MPGKWGHPHHRVYEYNYQVMNNYYRPMAHYLGRKEDHVLEKKTKETPGAQSFAERIKTFPLYGGIYPEYPLEYQEWPMGCGKNPYGWRKGQRHRASSLPPSFALRQPFPEPEETEAALKEAKKLLQDLEDQIHPRREPLWKKHPYYLPEESIRVPPHEGSLWPEGRPHFHLVSSYDLMVNYLKGGRGEEKVN